MKRFAKSQITIELKDKIKYVPKNLKRYNCKIDDRNFIFLEDKVRVNEILKAIEKNNLEIVDVNIESSSLEDIFIRMIRKGISFVETSGKIIAVSI
ncbi:MAG: DUF4162 domain-containing protein [Bacteroidetes bacterium]|nr:DUF4162 domain-containing protein [Bacteroidota bacterium]